MEENENKTNKVNNNNGEEIKDSNVYSAPTEYQLLMKGFEFMFFKQRMVYSIITLYYYILYYYYLNLLLNLLYKFYLFILLFKKRYLLKDQLHF